MTKGGFCHTGSILLGLLARTGMSKGCGKHAVVTVVLCHTRANDVDRYVWLRLVALVQPISATVEQDWTFESWLRSINRFTAYRILFRCDGNIPAPTHM
eukprot:37404-Pleurochrysis_carterae.AAC.3